MNERKGGKPPSQKQKFEDAARKAEADEDEVRWEERLRAVAKPKLSTDSTKR